MLYMQLFEIGNLVSLLFYMHYYVTRPFQEDISLKMAQLSCLFSSSSFSFHYYFMINVITDKISGKMQKVSIMR